MTKDELRQILIIISSNYKNFYKNYSKEELDVLRDTWYTFFNNIPQNVMMLSVKNYMAKVSSFPPTIADINELNARTLFSKERNKYESWDHIYSLCTKDIQVENKTTKTKVLKILFDDKEISQEKWHEILSQYKLGSDERMNIYDRTKEITEEYEETNYWKREAMLSDIENEFNQTEKELIKSYSLYQIRNSDDFLRNEYLKRYEEMQKDKNNERLERLGTISESQIDFLLEDKKILKIGE